MLENKYCRICLALLIYPDEIDAGLCRKHMKSEDERIENERHKKELE